MKPGAMLKEELKVNRGLQFKFVAKKTGIPYSTLRQYLNDFIPIPEVKIRTICLTFGISLEKFGFDKSETQSDKQQKLALKEGKSRRQASNA